MGATAFCKACQVAKQKFDENKNYRCDNRVIRSFLGYTYYIILNKETRQEFTIARKNQATGETTFSSCGMPTGTTRRCLQSLGKWVKIRRGVFVNPDGSIFQDEDTSVVFPA